MTEPFILDQCERRMEVHDGFVVVFHYSHDVHPTMGKLVDSRTTTYEGHTVQETYSPPIPMAGVPPLPIARLAMGLAAEDVKRATARKRKTLTSADIARRGRRQARRAKLREARTTD